MRIPIRGCEALIFGAVFTWAFYGGLRKYKAAEIDATSFVIVYVLAQFVFALLVWLCAGLPNEEGHVAIETVVLNMAGGGVVLFSEYLFMATVRNVNAYIGSSTQAITFIAGIAMNYAINSHGINWKDLLIGESLGIVGLMSLILSQYFKNKYLETLSTSLPSSSSTETNMNSSPSAQHPSTILADTDGNHTGQSGDDKSHSAFNALGISVDMTGPNFQINPIFMLNCQSIEYNDNPMLNTNSTSHPVQPGSTASADLDSVPKSSATEEEKPISINRVVGTEKNNAVFCFWLIIGIIGTTSPFLFFCHITFV